MDDFNVRWCVEASLEEIDRRSELALKLELIQPFTIEEMYLLRASLRTSDSYIRLLQRDLQEASKNKKKKFKFFGRK